MSIDSHTFGVTLLVLYILVANNPLARFGNIVQAVDPTSQLDIKGYPQWGGIYGRLKNGAVNLSQLAILLTVLKLADLIPYPGSDKIWLLVTSVLIVAAAVGKVWTDKAFWTDKLTSPGDTPEHIYDLLTRLANDFGDLAILILLASFTVYKNIQTPYLHWGILIFLAILLIASVARDWFGLLGHSNQSSPWSNPELSPGCYEPSGCMNSLKPGAIYGTVDWFFNQSGQMHDSFSPQSYLSMYMYDEFARYDKISEPDYIFHSVLDHQSSYIISRMLLVFALLAFAKKGPWASKG